MTPPLVKASNRPPALRQPSVQYL